MKLRFLSVILSIISLLMFGSCALNTTSAVHQNTNKPAVQTSYIKITVGSDSRTALPDISASDFDCFVLTGVDTSGDAAISEEWDTSNDGTAYAKMTAANIAVNVGDSYDFTLTAMKGGALWRGTASKVIEQGANQLNFTLKFISLTDEGEGAIQVVLSVPSVVEAVDAVLRNFDETQDVTPEDATVDFTSGVVTYTASGIESGNYVLVFTLYGDEAKTLKLAEWREYAGITDGMLSTSSPSVTELDSICSITLLPNGGELSGTFAGSYTRYTENVVLPKSENISRAGYSFLGWYEVINDVTQDTSTDGWEAGDKTGNVTLWAKWSPLKVTYTVKYYKQSTWSDSYYQSVPSVERDGTTDEMTDVTADSIEGFDLQPIEQHRIAWDGSTVVEVKYKRKIITYIFRIEGGIWADGTTGDKTVSGKYDSSVSNPAPKGYNYTWDSEIPYYFGSDDGKVFTATQSTPITYTIKFNVNGGAGSMSDLDATYDVSVDLPENTFTRGTGWTFLGWNTDKDARTQSYVDGQSVKNLTRYQGDEVRLYAIWKYNNNHIIDESGDMYGNMHIDGTNLPYTSFVKVMDNDVIIDGTDDNWNSYLPNIKNMRHFNRGVFTADNSGDVRKIKLSPYRISKYEVTRNLFETVMKQSFSEICEILTDYSCWEYDLNALGESEPFAMCFVSWFDAIAFCNKLSLLMGKNPCYSVDGINNWENLSYYAIPDNTADSMYSKWADVTVDMTANGYRLPTEAEWEFAARGGDQSLPEWKYAYAGVQSSDKAFDSVDNSNVYLKNDDNLENYGWFGLESDDYYDCLPRIHTVGLKTANRLGLYDMSGNLYELCWDVFNSPFKNDAAYMDNGVIVNPLGAATDPYGGINRSYRGGASNCEAGRCTVSYRNMGDMYTRSPAMGFRLAQTVTE